MTQDVIVHPDKLFMQFDMNTIQHLGVKLYSRLEPVLGELVANSWDADADEVLIQLFDQKPEEKSIVIEDTGNGMTFSEINSKFLKIGKNSRESGQDTTPSGRKVIGRKGIGKLSIFGIAEEIIITTKKDGKKNQFKMALSDILSSNSFYYPEQVITDQPCKEGNGTIIELKNFKKKSPFSAEEIASDLAKRFLIFGPHFRVKIISNNDSTKLMEVTNEMRFNKTEKEFVWSFPNEKIKTDYEYTDQVIGEIYSATKPVPASMKGIYLVARGKLVHSNDFYGIRADDYAHSYITGWLNVDFIDEDADEDLIATNRESLNWENEKCEKLQKYLQQIIKFTVNDWRDNRRTIKEEEVKKKGIDVQGWVSSLPKQDQGMAKKITNVILNNPNMDSDKSTEILSYVRDSFEFGSFKEFAAELEDLDETTYEDLIKLFKDWQIIEAKEMYKLALIRIKAIQEFAKKIEENAREVPEMHEFLRNFPWLLDPRILNFEDEVRYSKLLKEHFKEDAVLEQDKRIDFLCIDLADTIFIIELKRPKTKANDKFLDQALQYASFLKEKKGNDPEFARRTIKTYIVCDGIVNKPEVREKADAYNLTNKVYVKNYLDLLRAAENYHKEFIQKYEKIKLHQSKIASSETQQPAL